MRNFITNPLNVSLIALGLVLAQFAFTFDTYRTLSSHEGTLVNLVRGDLPVFAHKDGHIRAIPFAINQIVLLNDRLDQIASRSEE